MKFSPSLPISLLAAAVSCAAKAPSPKTPPEFSPQSQTYHSSVVQPDDSDIRECDEAVDEFLISLSAGSHQCDRERVQFDIGQVVLRCREMFTPMRAEMIQGAIARAFGNLGRCDTERNRCEHAIDSARRAIANLANTCTDDVSEDVRFGFSAVEHDCSTSGGRQLAAEQRGIRQELQMADLQCSVNAIARKLGIEPRNQSLRNK